MTSSDAATLWASAAPDSPGIVDTLLVGLASRDPAVRDETVYPLFTHWIREGRLDDSLMFIGDRLAAMFDDPAIQARTFATLILAATVRRVSALAVEVPDRWRTAFGSWWSSETDLRGYDRDLGWLHAIAHGADAVRAFALDPTASNDSLQWLLALVTTRLLTPTDYVFEHAEDDRAAYALAVLLSRPAMTDHVSWLHPIDAAFAAGEPGPVPAWISNTQRTLNSLYVAVDRGVVVYDGTEASEVQTSRARSVVLGRISDILRLPSHWLG